MEKLMKVFEDKVIVKYNESNDDISINANEVSKILDIKNVSQMLKTIDDDEKELITIIREDGKTHKAWVLKEYGLYEVLMQSRKPIAKEFKKEIKKLLKYLRKEYNTSLREGINQKLIGYENFLNSSKEVISLSMLAEKYELSYQELLNFLKENHFIFKKGKNLILYREHKYKNYVKYYRKKGELHLYLTLKGEKYIDNLINQKVKGE